MNRAQDVQISVKEKLSYGIGDFMTSLIFTAIGSFLTIFYTDVVGLAPAAIGTMMLVVRVFDGIADIGMGAVVDRTKSKHGKARPWLLWLSVPFGVGVILLFTAPDLGPTGSLIYAYVTYLFINLVYTAINIPYSTLTALITQDPYQRSLLNIFRMTSAMLGAAIIIFVTMPIVNSFGGGKTGWFATFLIFGLLAPFMYLITFKFTKERVKPVAVKEHTVPLKEALPALFRNKYWIMLVVLSVVMFISSGLGGGLNAYYAKYILNDANLVGLLGLAGLVPMLIGVPLTAPLVKRFGKRNVALYGMALSIIGTLIVIIDPYNVTYILIGTIFRTLLTAPLAATMGAMLADTIDYGEWKTGIRSEGLVFSAGSFGTKVGSGIGGGLLGWMLALSGYNGTSTVQTPETLSMLKGIFIYLPFVITAVTVIILAFYKLDKQFDTITEELRKRSTPPLN